MTATNNAYLATGTLFPRAPRHLATQFNLQYNAKSAELLLEKVVVTEAIRTEEGSGAVQDILRWIAGGTGTSTP